MKKILLSALLAVSTMTASAQLQEANTFAIEPHIGLGYSLTSGFAGPDALKGYEEMSGGISVEIGADAIYKFTDRFGASAGLNFYGLTTDEINNVKYEVYSLEIPVLAHYNFTSNLSAFAGIKFSFPVTIDENYDGTKTDGKKYYESTNFLLPIGVKWTFASKWSLSAQYDIALSKWNKNEPAYNLSDTRVSPIMLNLGYRFDL